jgi:hypothetical protein
VIDMRHPGKRDINLRSIFLGLQEQMVAKLSTSRRNIAHPGTKGDATELGWREMLNAYLPKRYQVDKAFVLDADGRLSEQIDIVIFDRQYSPFLFNQHGAIYIPAESVYAAIEVKQDLNKKELEYAGFKAASVRRLRRTSAPIPHAGGVYPAKKHFDIIAGLVTLGSTWRRALSSKFDSAVAELPKNKRIDLGCALHFGAFEVIYEHGAKVKIEKSGREDALIFFFLRLLSRLQTMGTAPALDIDEYAKSLNACLAKNGNLDE